MSFSATINLGTVGDSILDESVSISGCTGINSSNECTGCTIVSMSQLVSSFPKIIEGFENNHNYVYVEVISGNCIGESQCMVIGGKTTPAPTATPTSTPIPTSTPVPTATPTSTPGPTVTTAPPTATPTPTATNTPAPTVTTAPPTPTPTATSTNTPTPTATNTPTPTPTIGDQCIVIDYFYNTNGGLSDGCGGYQRTDVTIRATLYNYDGGIPVNASETITINFDATYSDCLGTNSDNLTLEILANNSYGERVYTQSTYDLCPYDQQCNPVSLTVNGVESITPSGYVECSVEPTPTPTPTPDPTPDPTLDPTNEPFAYYCNYGQGCIGQVNPCPPEAIDCGFGFAPN